jgi:hypothetical protein
VALRVDVRAEAAGGVVLVAVDDAAIGEDGDWATTRPRPSNSRRSGETL